MELPKSNSVNKCLRAALANNSDLTIKRIIFTDIFIYVLLPLHNQVISPASPLLQADAGEEEICKGSSSEEFLVLNMHFFVTFQILNNSK